MEPPWTIAAFGVQSSVFSVCCTTPRFYYPTSPIRVCPSPHHCLILLLNDCFRANFIHKMMTLYYKTHIRLSLQSAPAVSRQLHLGRSLVSDGCRLGQRLRRCPLFISVCLKTATRPQLLGRSGLLERRHVSCYRSIGTRFTTLGITHKS